MKNSEMIYARLIEEANQFSVPQKRLATLNRLKTACDLIAAGGRVRVEPGEKFTFRKANQKINPSNIDRVVRSKKWTGPTRSFIANRTNGLLEYVNACEEERTAHGAFAPAFLPTQIESLLSEIESVEVRQAMRNEIERRRTAEQEIKIIKEALKKLPQIDVRSFLKGPVTTEKMEMATGGPQSALRHEQNKQVRSLVERLSKGDLRHLGLKRNGEDIVSMSNAPVVLRTELKALVELAGLPLSLLSQE